MSVRTGKSGVACEATDGERSPLVRRPSVWLHGAGLSGSTWRNVTRALPLSRAPDLPGHGSADAIFPPTVEGFADALQPSIPNGAVLIGHSLGGMVALELAARATSKIAALILIECVPTVRDTLSGRISAMVAKAVMRMLSPRQLAWLSGLGQTKRTKDELQSQIARNSTANLVTAMDAAASYDGRPLLSQISVPTLVIVGLRNRAKHSGAQTLATGIPDAEFAQLAGGHVLHTDNPVQLRRAIDGFLTRI